MSGTKEGVLEGVPSPYSDGQIKRREVRPWWYPRLGGKDISYISVNEGYESLSSSKEDLVQNVHNVWTAPEAQEVYKPVEGYEGSHRFDPNAEWTPQEEKKLRRMLDWRVALPACIMFFALQLDRGNITQALADNMLKDLHMNTNDYNNGQTIFYCSFLFAELPSQLIGKKLGPDTWIPIQMCLWSIVAGSQAALTNRTSFFICRALLGLFEGGFIPDTILYLSFFYKNDELPRRLSWFWTSYQGTQIIGAFLAFGILHLRDNAGLYGWKWLFLIESLISFSIGVFTFLYLPASPTQTKRKGFRGILRPKQGWFTEREEVIMVTRILRDDPGKSTMHNRQILNWKLFREALSDYDMWPIYLMGLSWQIIATPPQNYITLTCKALGFTTFQTNLLTIPAYTLFILQLLFWTWVSEKINQRILIALIAQIWCLPCLIALVTLPPKFNGSNWSRWTLSTLIVGYPYAHAIIVALTSRNAGTVRTRTIGSSLYNMAVQAASIFSTQIYRNDDKPYYYTGNKILLGILAYNCVIIIGSKIYYVIQNERRNKIWDNMTREDRVNYLATTTDKGNKRLDFRFAS